MNAFAHSRTPSEESNGASSYQFILEHVFQYPGSYEIPLRTMYTINSLPRAQPLPKETSRAGTPTSNPSAPSSPTSAHFPSDTCAASAQFTASLMHQLSKLPTQPCSLPPSFIISFVLRVFPPDLALVDFPQALTALDYLKDLETRRCKEMVAALGRLGVAPHSIDSDVHEISNKYPGVAQWVQQLLDKQKKVEALYTQIWIGLRRWILVNELSLIPFNKHNCLAMLNTLYPPVPSSQPTKILTPHVMKSQRDGFFKYIKSVEKCGPSVLSKLMEQGKLPNDENGWGAVQQTLDRYLFIAKDIIDDCMNMGSVSVPSEETTSSVTEARQESTKSSKYDSGFSFGKRPSTSGSSGSSKRKQSLSASEEQKSYKGLSTLEKITREFRKMRLKSKVEAEEMVPAPAKPVEPAQAEQPHPELAKTPKKSLRKMRSLGALSLRHGNASSTSLSSRRKPSDLQPFDAEAMKKARLEYEARNTN